MGWFSPVKGHYPSLSQIDKTLPVENTDASKAIRRGTILALTAGDKDNPDGVWQVASGASSGVLYVALQDYTDPTAGFAGTAFTPNPTAKTPAVPAITGLDLSQEGEYETSEFDHSLTYAVGDALYVGQGGVLTKTSGGANKKVGVVTRGKTERWVNNAIALPPGGTDQRLAIRTGAPMTVIRFTTAD